MITFVTLSHHLKALAEKVVPDTDKREREKLLIDAARHKALTLESNRQVLLALAEKPEQVSLGSATFKRFMADLAACYDDPALLPEAMAILAKRGVGWNYATDSSSDGRVTSEDLDDLGTPTAEQVVDAAVDLTLQECFQDAAQYIFDNGPGGDIVLGPSPVPGTIRFTTVPELPAARWPRTIEEFELRFAKFDEDDRRRAAASGQPYVKRIYGHSTPTASATATTNIPAEHGWGPSDIAAAMPIKDMLCKKCGNKSMRIAQLPDSDDHAITCRLCGGL